MATFNKTNAFRESLVEGVNAGTDTWRVILSNTAPTASTTNQASAAELTTSGGYTVNGNTCSITSSAQTSGTYKLVLHQRPGRHATENQRAHRRVRVLRAHRPVGHAHLLRHAAGGH